MEDLGNNAFFFTFPDQVIQEKISFGGPRNVRGQMLILKPWSPQLSIGEIDLHSTLVWIQIHSLPMFKMTERCIKNMGQLVGPVLGPDFPVHAKIHVSHFFRVQVLLDPRKPLILGYYQKRLEAKPCWVQLKYEKISDFCYAYGCIGHTRSSCEIKFRSSYMNFRFSPKMKAEGPGSEFRKWSIEASLESPVGNLTLRLQVLPLPGIPLLQVSSRR